VLGEWFVTLVITFVANNDKKKKKKRTITTRKIIIIIRLIMLVIIIMIIVFFQPKVHVNYDFQPRTADELEIHRGEVITVTNNSEADWWEGQVERDNVIHKGHFPVTYVTQI